MVVCRQLSDCSQSMNLNNAKGKKDTKICDRQRMLFVTKKKSPYLGLF